MVAALTSPCVRSSTRCLGYLDTHRITTSPRVHITTKWIRTERAIGKKLLWKVIFHTALFAKFMDMIYPMQEN